MKTAIVLDLEQTLVTVIEGMTSTNGKRETLWTMRPGLKHLFEYLVTLKQIDVDTILWTGAKRNIAETFLQKEYNRPYKNLFKQIICEEDFLRPQPEDPGYRIYQKYPYNMGKDITLLGYDNVILCDDSASQIAYIQEIYDQRITIPTTTYVVQPAKVYNLCGIHQMVMQCIHDPSNMSKEKIELCRETLHTFYEDPTYILLENEISKILEKIGEKKGGFQYVSLVPQTKEYIEKMQAYIRLLYDKEELDQR